MSKRSARIIYEGVKRTPIISEYFIPTFALATSKLTHLWNKLFPLKKTGNATVNVTSIDESKMSVRILTNISETAKSLRKKPRFVMDINEFKSDSDNVSETLSRKERALPAMVTAAIPYLGRFIFWTATTTAATAAGLAIDREFKKGDEKRQEERFARISLNCNLNNVGCLQNLCWTNCGPRIQSSDYCFTTRNKSATINGVMIVADCKVDSDCDRCWPCASSCLMDDFNFKKIIETNSNISQPF